MEKKETQNKQMERKEKKLNGEDGHFAPKCLNLFTFWNLQTKSIM